MDELPKEPEPTIRATDPHRAAFFRALANIDLIKDIPEGDEEIAEWEAQNPDKAQQLERAVDNVLREFSLSIEPLEDQIDIDQSQSPNRQNN